MRLYRICHARYLEDLRGLGASYRDGARWNEAGVPIVYFAETPSVAMLEMAHYLPSPRLVPPGYRLNAYDGRELVPMPPSTGQAKLRYPTTAVTLDALDSDSTAGWPPVPRTDSWRKRMRRGSESAPLR